MKKKTVVVSILLLLALLAAGLVYLSASKIQHRQQAEVTRQTLPIISAWTTDSVLVRYEPIQPARSTVVMYFNSECSVCQYEAQAIYQDSAALQHANIVMLSSEPLAAIRTFAADYGLDRRENITLLGIDPVAVTRLFGAVSTPSVLIYNPQGRLVQYYRGETSTEAIAQHL